MKIDVWVEDAPVGTLELEGRYDFGRFPAEVPILAVTESIQKYGPDSASLSQMIWVPVATHYVRIDTLDIQSLLKFGVSSEEIAIREVLSSKRAPDYATKLSNFGRIGGRYGWHVLTPSVPVYEKLFDLRNFTPY